MALREKRFGERCVGLGGWGWRGAGADGNERWRKGSGRVRWYMVLGYLCLICIARMQYYRETTIQARGPFVDRVQDYIFSCEGAQSG